MIELSLSLTRGDFSFSVETQLPGSGVIGVFGPSGCGKTTLLRTIAGLEPASGTVRINGDLWQDEKHKRPVHQRPLGYVFQEPSLFPHLTVEQNIKFGVQRIDPGLRKVSWEQAVALLNLENLIDRRPDKLSGGEQQRVAIARALAVSPSVLLMDEPLSALDQGLKNDILPYLETLHRQLEIPILYVSHSLEEISRLSDHLLLMDKGRVLASDATSEVLTSLKLPLAQQEDATTIIECECGPYDEEYHLAQLRFSGGDLQVAMPTAPNSTTQRVQIAARDVSIVLAKASDTSILNCFPAQVLAVAELGAAHSLVRLKAGSDVFLSRITRKSLHQLQLNPGKQVFAQIKSVAVLS